MSTETWSKSEEDAFSQVVRSELQSLSRRHELETENANKEIMKVTPKPYGETISRKNYISDFLDVNVENSKNHKKLRINRVVNLSAKCVRVPLNELETVEKLPSMGVWASIQRNVRVDDEPILNHIPYMNDDLPETNHTFFDELFSCYDGRIVHTKRVINDHLLYDLVNALKQKEEQFPKLKVPYGEKVEEAKKEEENNSDNSDKKDIGEDIVLTNILKFIAKEVFTDDICEAHGFDISKISELATTDLQVRFMEYNSKLVSRKFLSTGRCVEGSAPNIDGELSQVLPVDQAVHSYNHLICVFCFTYDCNNHRDEVDEDFIFKKLYDISAGNRKEDKTTNACQNDCYKKKTEEDWNSYSQERLETVFRDWSNSIKTAFNVVYETFADSPDRYCSIAAILRKPCWQVCAYVTYINKQKPAVPIEIKKEENAVVSKKRVHAQRQSHRSIQTRIFRSKAPPPSSKIKYTPCNHPGSCIEGECPCCTVRTFCEKYCYCPPDCLHRFKGCACRGRCNSRSCNCVIAIRECDPDLCTHCFPEHEKHYTKKDEYKCKNTSIQRGLHKRLLLGVSEVAGWGIFINETVNKYEFIAEYCGEIITQYEAERRGKVYDQTKTSFLFNVNNEHVIDAKRKGNKIRFANHSVNPNCFARVYTVNGEHRIGIFANRKIKRFEELFFDYSYGPRSQSFVDVERDFPA